MVEPEDDGIIEDAEVAARVADEDLVRFEAKDSSVRAAEVAALRAKVARWRPPMLNQDRHK